MAQQKTLNGHALQSELYHRQQSFQQPVQQI
jgi:hypothetical protein